MTLREHLTRVVAVGLAGTVWWFLYSWINAFNARSDRAVFLASTPSELYPNIIQPSSAVVYVLGSLVLLIAPLVYCWQKPRFLAFMTMVAIGTVVGFIIFLIWPLNIRRPVFTGDRFGESMLRWIFSIDQNANCFPSFHSFFAVLGALVVAQYAQHWQETVGAWLLAILILISTVTTGQHYVIDGIAGSALAVLSFLVVHIFPRSQPTL